MKYAAEDTPGASAPPVINPQTTPVPHPASMKQVTAQAIKKAAEEAVLRSFGLGKIASRERDLGLAGLLAGYGAGHFYSRSRPEDEDRGNLGLLYRAGGGLLGGALGSAVGKHVDHSVRNERVMEFLDALRQTRPDILTGVK